MSHFIRNVVIMHESMERKWNGARKKWNCFVLHIETLVFGAYWMKNDGILMHHFSPNMIRWSLSTHFSVFPLLWYGHLIRSSRISSIRCSTFVCLFYRIGDWFWVLSQGLSSQWQQTTHTHTLFLFISSYHQRNQFVFLLWYRIRALIAFGVFSYRKHHT